MPTLLITGATGAIGTKVCHYLANKKYALMLAARDEKKLEKLSNELVKKYKIDVQTYSFDFSLIETIDKFAQKVQEQQKKLMDYC